MRGQLVGGGFTTDEIIINRKRSGGEASLNGVMPAERGGLLWEDTSGVTMGESHTVSNSSGPLSGLDASLMVACDSSIKTTSALTVLACFEVVISQGFFGRNNSDNRNHERLLGVLTHRCFLPNLNLSADIGKVSKRGDERGVYGPGPPTLIRLADLEARRSTGLVCIEASRAGWFDPITCSTSLSQHRALSPSAARCLLLR